MARDSRSAICAPGPCVASASSWRGARHRRPSRVRPATLPYAIAGAWEGSVSGALRLPARSDAWIDLGDDDAPRFPLVPANRTSEGVISAFSVKENLTLPLIGRLRGRAAISAGREADLVDGWIDRLGIPDRRHRRSDHHAQRWRPAEGRDGALPGPELLRPRAVRGRPRQGGRRYRRPPSAAVLRPDHQQARAGLGAGCSCWCIGQGRPAPGPVHARPRPASRRHTRPS